MNVTVMSLPQCMDYCRQPHTQRVLIISIGAPYINYGSDQPFMSDDNGVCCIVRRLFKDADKPGLDSDGRPCTEDELFNYDDAMWIHNFMTLYPNADIIVHCDGGVSRSAGVAAAILKAKTGDDTAIFNNPKYRPNMRCYRMMLNELMMGDGKHVLDDAREE